MMRMRTKSPATAAGQFRTFVATKDRPASIPVDEPAKLEVLPTGMLVQKRSSEESAPAVPVPTVRLRVKHGSVFHEIYISSQATFGELKKLIAERTGLHPLDQKITFKGKERDSAAFLDVSGVKDRSKMVVVEDPAAQAKRLLEMRRALKVEKSAKSISQITVEVDKLASQVSAMEAEVLKGGKIAESEVLRLIELLMNELLKLDGVAVDGDAKSRRRVQVRRVQTYVEKLDLILLKNTKPKASTGQAPPPQQHKKNQPPPSPPLSSVIVSTKWETFHSLFSPGASASTSATTTASSTAASSAAPTPRLDWELF